MNADKIASNENTALDEKSRIVETIRAIDDFYRQADELYRQTAWRMGLPDCAFDIVYALVNEDGLTLALSFLLLGVISWVPAGVLPEGLAPAENPPAALVGSVVGAVGVITLGMAVTLPLIMRFGMTRATRFVPVVVVIALALGIGFFDAGIQPTGVLADLVQWLDTGSNYLFLAAALVAVVALIYVASAFVAAKLYEKREF